MQKLSVYLSDKDTTTIQLLKMYLAELDYVEIIGEGESLNNNYQDIINLSPSIIIADVSGDFNDNYEIAEKILTKLPSVKIIATASDYSTDIVIRAMRAGIREFLPKPLIKDNLGFEFNAVCEVYVDEAHPNVKRPAFFRPDDPVK